MKKLLLLGILVLAAALRLAWLGHDLPRDLEPTNAPAQDAFWYLEAAQAPADGSGVDPQPAYDRPLWVAIARAWFAVAPTGIASASALSAVFGVAGVLGVFLAFPRERRRAALLASVLLATSYPFCGLARTPLIYSPLAGLMALAFALHARGGLAARIGAYALLLVLAGAFKGVALVMVPGLAASETARRATEDTEGTERRKNLSVTSMALLVLGLALVAWLDPAERARNVERIQRYLAPGLDAAAIAKRLLLAPRESGLVRLAPGLLGLAAIGATRWRRPLVLGAVAWAATVIFGLALLDYHPLRFYALAGPPLAILAGTGAEALIWPGSGRKRAPLVAGLVAANGLALLTTSWLREAAPALAVGAALLVLLIPLPRLEIARRLGLSLVVLTLGFDLGRDLVPTGTTLLDANRSARECLAPGSVLGGPYASVLAAGTRGLERRRAPTIFGGPRAKEGIENARKLGVTHVALDEDQDRRGAFASGFTAQGAPPTLVLSVNIRGERVLVYRLQR